MPNVPALINLFGKSSRTEFRHIDEFVRKANGQHGTAPSVCSVLFQSYPYEFSQEFVNSLIQAAPISPILLIAGAGCEGEARTGKPPIGVVRLYASQWDAWYETEFYKLLAQQNSFFSLPKTAGNDEIAVYLAARPDFERIGK